MTDAATLAKQGFRTVFGHELVGELPAFVHRPYLVVTMADLWPRFEQQLAGPSLAGVHEVETLELSDLVALEERLPRAAAIIGLGGGQALDRQRKPARRAEGTGAGIGQAGLNQAVSHQALEVLARAGLHAGGNFLREKLDQQVGHQSITPRSGVLSLYWCQP